MAARWSLVDQYPENYWPRSGTPVPGRRFTIREESTGSEDDFWLPASQLSPEIVAQEAQTRADTIEALGRLGNG